MTGWIKIDNSMPSHPKVLMVGDRASWLHVCGVCYSNEHLTDGFIARHVLAVVAPGVKSPERLVAQLVAAELWHATATGWQIHDYAEHQSSASEIRERRQRDADRKAAARASVRSPSGQTSDSGGTAVERPSGVLVQEEEEKRREEEKPATQAARKRARPAIDQTKRPDDFPVALVEVGKRVLVILHKVWDARGGIEPQARNVGLAIMRNDRADHVAVARELEQYMTSGGGLKLRCGDIAQRYGDRVESAPAAARRDLSLVAAASAGQDPGRFDRAAKAKREAREQRDRDQQLGDTA